MTKNITYCCKAKEYFIQNNAVSETLQITPRVITYSKPMKLKKIYEKQLVIKNNGIYPRHLIYSTDSPDDIEITVSNNARYTYIEPQDTAYVTIAIRPHSNNCINCVRYVYIEAEHPNIKFEVPILHVGHGKKTPILPETIEFPRSTPKSLVFYEFVICNSSAAKIPVIIKTTNPILKIVMPDSNLPKKSFLRVLLIITVKGMYTFQDSIKIKFESQPYLTTECVHKPIASLRYISVSHLRFDEVKFNREIVKEFRICNDSSKSVNYDIQFEFATHENLHEQEENSSYNSVDSVSYEPSMGSFETATNVQHLQQRKTLTDVFKEKFDTAHIKHFHLNQRDGQIEANYSATFIVTFRPFYDDEFFDETLESPFSVKSKLLINFEIDPKIVQNYNVILSGLIRGPIIELTPSSIDIRLYMGEEHCQPITVLNVDGKVSAHVYFKNYTNQNSAVVKVKPDTEQVIESCKRATFIMSMYTCNIGKFNLKLKFKVKSGSTHIVVIRGVSLQVRLKCFPDIIELGTVPMCVPQKRFLLIMNPLNVPVTVQCVSTDDGEEVPLVLNIRNVEELPPIDIKDPIKQMLEYKTDKKEDEQVPEFVTDIDAKNSQITFRSLSCESSYSARFEEDLILGSMTDMATTLVDNLKRKRVLEKPEMEYRAIKETVECLMTNPYFEKIADNVNYAFMDWNALPIDPKEIYCNSEVIYLSPNNGHKLTVFVIPNITGYHNHALEIRVCPIIENQICMDEDGAQLSLANSELFTSKVWIEYNCRVPDVDWKNEIVFNDKIIYTGQEYDFDYEFENRSTVCGFVYFDVVPHSELGQMIFRDNVWKMCLLPNFVTYMPCAVIFKRTGRVVLPGIVKFLGNRLSMPFSLIADVLPTKVQVAPNPIYNRQKVLDKSKVRVFITNITPTKTWVTFYLRCERFQHLDIRGMILGPDKQGMYVTIHSKFYDPDVHLNTLYVDLNFGCTIEVPLTYNVIGVPILFDPDIKDDFDMGRILTNSEKNFHDDIPNFKKPIRVWNYGERKYIIKVRKLRTTQTLCVVPDVKARLTVVPTTFTLSPGEGTVIHIAANACEEASIYNEFRMLIADVYKKQRFTNVRFSARAQFIKLEVNWDRKEICMNYYRTHKFKEHLFQNVAYLTNIANIPIENVDFHVLGPFGAKLLFEDNFQKDLKFEIAGLEKKEVTIALNKGAIKNKYCTHIAHGRIVCTANELLQKPLYLKVNVFNPELIITQPDLILFRKYHETDVEVEITNVGCLEAEYKWKKLKQATYYVSEIDYETDFAHELLSDILRMLDFGGSDSDADSLYQRNLSLRYHKFRCRLERLEDEVDVAGIVNELIDNLDYEHRRYAMTLEKSIESETSMDVSSEHSVKSYVERTLDHVLGLLKLEDSYNVTPVSSQECLLTRRVYFYEKSGSLMEKQQTKCLLHLPGVRKGYVVNTIFELEVVGGITRTLNVRLLNLERTIVLKRDNIYLGVLPWYELFKAHTKIQNVTQYTISIRLDKRNKTLHNQRIIYGYTKLLNDRCFDLKPIGLHKVRLEGTIGFSDAFKREYKLTVNDSDEFNICVRGQGVMPILSVTDPLERIEQEPEETIEEYKLLQRIYYFEMFRGLTEEDEELSIFNEEYVDIPESVSLQFDFSEMDTGDEGGEEEDSSRERRFYEYMKTYVQATLIEVPDALLLEQLLTTEKFLDRLKWNPDTLLILRLVYQDYVRMISSYDDKMPVNLKHFTAQPLPCESHGYVLNMSGLMMNTIKRFYINFQFFGPGKLIIAVRSVIKIPGLFVEVDILPSDKDQDKQFLYYTSDEKKPDLHKKRYRNMYERLMDAETDPKLKHAHSFDINPTLKHTRDVTTKDRKSLQNYYNSLNKSVYMEHKHHYILCKVFTNCKYNFSGTKFIISIFFKPEPQFYEVEQMLVDYLYVDLHLGPTMPILLRGLISE